MFYVNTKSPNGLQLYKNTKVTSYKQRCQIWTNTISMFTHPDFFCKTGSVCVHVLLKKLITKHSMKTWQCLMIISFFSVPVIECCFSFYSQQKKIYQQQNIPVFRSFNASFFSTSVKFYFKPKFPFLFLCDLTPAWTALENHLKQKLGVQYLWLLEIVFQYSVY